MGQKGREIVEMELRPLIQALQGLYADEWLAHYHYLHAAQIITGLYSPQVSGMLKARSADELAHALRLGERILELGGTLPQEWAAIPALANHKAFAFPKNPSDVQGILKVVLQAERRAIAAYQELLKKTLHNDTVTHELAEELLADEVKDEEETENLLGKS